MSPISSRNSVPPSANSKRPFRLDIAPVNAPFSWPNSSLSRSSPGIAPQLTGMKGPSARSEQSCTKRAMTSLPVPDSPCSKTVASVGATFETRDRTSEIASLTPTNRRSRCLRWRCAVVFLAVTVTCRYPQVFPHPASPDDSQYQAIKAYGSARQFFDANMNEVSLI